MLKECSHSEIKQEIHIHNNFSITIIKMFCSGSHKQHTLISASCEQSHSSWIASPSATLEPSVNQMSSYCMLCSQSCIHVFQWHYILMGGLHLTSLSCTTGQPCPHSTSKSLPHEPRIGTSIFQHQCFASVGTILWNALDARVCMHVTKYSMTLFLHAPENLLISMTE